MSIVLFERQAKSGFILLPIRHGFVNDTHFSVHYRAINLEHIVSVYPNDSDVNSTCLSLTDCESSEYYTIHLPFAQTLQLICEANAIYRGGKNA